MLLQKPIIQDIFFLLPSVVLVKCVLMLTFVSPFSERQRFLALHMALNRRLVILFVPNFQQDSMSFVSVLLWFRVLFK